MYSVGKMPSTFWPGWDMRREPASCVGGQENSVIVDYSLSIVFTALLCQSIVPEALSLCRFA